MLIYVKNLVVMFLIAVGQKVKLLIHLETSLSEVVCGTEQFWAPKLGARQLPDGSMVSPSLEDMSPFLSAEELAASRFVDEAGADGTDL